MAFLSFLESSRWSGGRGEASLHGPATAPLPPGPERLLIIARELTRGGAAYLALRHARRLSPRYSVDFLVTGPCDEDFLRELPEEMTVYRLGPAPLDQEGDWCCALHQFALDHREELPFRQVYHTVLATSTFPDLRACAAVCTVRTSRRFLFLVDESLAFYSRLESPTREIVEQCVVRSDLVLPVSRRLWSRMADRCPALRSREWRCLQPPVDVEAILRLAEEPQAIVSPGPIPNVLTVGRLSPEKQIPLCVRIHHELKQAGIGFRWYVIGEGPEEPKIRAEIQARGMENDFILLGKQANVFSVLRSCDIFALFSLSEGCPTVVLEALTLGLPVIMTDVNGSEEMLDHEETGLIVADNPRSIASGLARMVQDESLRRRFRTNLVQRAFGASLDEQRRRVLELVDAPGLPSPAPRVSVLISAYNQEAFIDLAIASALGQDHPSLEVLVLDHASTDGTEQAARAWEYDPRFRYIRSDFPPGRVADDVRSLIDEARGDWLLMLDRESFLPDPDFLSSACATIERHRERPIVFVQAGHRVRDLEGRSKNADVLPQFVEPEQVLSGVDYVRFALETNFLTRFGVLCRREALNRSRSSAGASSLESLLGLALDGDVLVLNRAAGDCVRQDAIAEGWMALASLKERARILRRIARQAVRRGLCSSKDLRSVLTHYEARTLVSLFDAMVGRSARGPFDLARFLGIAIAINPALLRDVRFLPACRRYAQTLVRPSLANAFMGRLALAGYRRLRAFYRRLGGKPLIESLAR